MFEGDDGEFMAKSLLLSDISSTRCKICSEMRKVVSGSGAAIYKPVEHFEWISPRSSPLRRCSAKEPYNFLITNKFTLLLFRKSPGSIFSVLFQTPFYAPFTIFYRFCSMLFVVQLLSAFLHEEAGTIAYEPISSYSLLTL